MAEMKPRERFVTALRCGIPDRVPVYDFLFSPRLQKELLGFTTELYDGQSQVKLASKLGLDGIFIPINGYCGFEDELHAQGSRYKDEWGITYIKSGWPVMVQIDVPIKSREDWKNYDLPDPHALHRVNTIKDAVKANKGELAIIAGFLGPFTMMYINRKRITNMRMAGQGFEFQVVAAVVLGGVSLSGGIGTLLGAFIGVLILGIIQNGLGMLNVNTMWQLVITGSIIIMSVAIDELKKRHE